MTPDAARADRFHAVREAARAWSRAHLIGDDARAQIDALYPDDRHRLSRGLAILAGVATFLGGQALVAAGSMLLGSGPTMAGAILLAWAAAFAFATEYQVGALRRAQAGAELATALLAASLACAGVWTLLLDDIDAGVVLAFAAAVFGAGAYRWGFATLAAFASLFALLALARLPFGRAWWIAGCAIAIVLAGSRRRAERLAPAHRRCLRVVFGAALLGLYVAIHYDSFRAAFLEWFGNESRVWGRGALAVSAVLTALVPLGILAFGVKRRDRLAIAIGALLLGASLATWRYHWPWAPMWLTLVLGGSACFVTAILVRRFLDRSPGREWRGITADPLLDDARAGGVLRVAGIAATLGASPSPAADRPFQAGGGTSGGGGAEGRF